MITTQLPLRAVLLLDAATCAGMGGLLAVASGPVARATALPPALLFWAGLSLFPIAAFMAGTARALAIRPTAARATTRLVIVGNALWVAGSLVLLVPGVATPNSLGVAFVLGQAAVVAVLAVLECGALDSETRVVRAS